MVYRMGTSAHDRGDPADGRRGCQRLRTVFSRGLGNIAALSDMALQIRLRDIQQRTSPAYFDAHSLRFVAGYSTKSVPYDTVPTTLISHRCRGSRRLLANTTWLFSWFSKRDFGLRLGSVVAAAMRLHSPRWREFPHEGNAARRRATAVIFQLSYGDERFVAPSRSCTFVGVHGRVKLVAVQKCIVPNAALRVELRNAGFIR